MTPDTGPKPSTLHPLFTQRHWEWLSEFASRFLSEMQIVALAQALSDQEDTAFDARFWAATTLGRKEAHDIMIQVLLDKPENQPN